MSIDAIIGFILFIVAVALLFYIIGLQIKQEHATKHKPICSNCKRWYRKLDSN
jgi:hypothetical protein